ncbi:hypothetical protein HDU91_001286, partial [Kappamyces sp. JEL0680]
GTWMDKPGYLVRLWDKAKDPVRASYKIHYFFEEHQSCTPFYFQRMLDDVSDPARSPPLPFTSYVTVAHADGSRQFLLGSTETGYSYYERDVDGVQRESVKTDTEAGFRSLLLDKFGVTVGERKAPPRDRVSVHLPDVTVSKYHLALMEAEEVFRGQLSISMAVHETTRRIVVAKGKSIQLKAASIAVFRVEPGGLDAVRHWPKDATTHRATQSALAFYHDAEQGLSEIVFGCDIPRTSHVMLHIRYALPSLAGLSGKEALPLVVSLGEESETLLQLSVQPAGNKLEVVSLVKQAPSSFLA